MSLVTCDNLVQTGIVFNPANPGIVNYGNCPGFPQWFAEAYFKGSYDLAIYGRSIITSPTTHTVEITVYVRAEGPESIYRYDLVINVDTINEPHLVATAISPSPTILPPPSLQFD